jgi:hypothetical protein
MGFPAEPAAHLLGANGELFDTPSPSLSAPFIRGRHHGAITKALTSASGVALVSIVKKRLPTYYSIMR